MQHFPSTHRNVECGQYKIFCLAKYASLVRSLRPSSAASIRVGATAAAEPSLCTRTGVNQQSRLGKNKNPDKTVRIPKRSAASSTNRAGLPGEERASRSRWQSVSLTLRSQRLKAMLCCAGAHLPRFPLSLDFRSLDRDLDLDLFAIGPLPHAAFNQ